MSIEQRSNRSSTPPIESLAPEEVDARDIIRYLREDAKAHYRVDEDGVARYYVAGIGTTDPAVRADPASLADEWFNFDAMNRDVERKQRDLAFIDRLKLAHRAAAVRRDMNEAMYGATYYEDEAHQRELIAFAAEILHADAPEFQWHVDFWRRECERYERTYGRREW
jgi:hypothetical protein